ncbi:MAG: hypothetical protein NOU37_04875 [Candidatus Brocadiales bacterium]|nr:hypothetical protein [Candidatus Bathyanammoxibius amoris]
MVNKKSVNIEFYSKDYRRIKEAARAEQMGAATWCRQKILQFLDGRLIEAPGATAPVLEESST